MSKYIKVRQTFEIYLQVPTATVTAEKMTEKGTSSNNAADQIGNQITQQGNLVRDLKSEKADKEKIDTEVKNLLALKAKFKELTGSEWKPSSGSANAPRSKESKPAKPAKPAKSSHEPTKPKEKDDGTQKKVTRLGLEATKEENLPEWYSQVLTKGELIEYYDVSGCYILRPWSFAIWKVIQRWFTDEIDKLGVKEVYFPLFVSRAALEKEKTHIADFSPEVSELGFIK